MKQMLVAFILLATLLPFAHAVPGRVCSALLEKSNAKPFESYVSAEEAALLKEYASSNRWADPLGSESSYTKAALRFLSNVKNLYHPHKHALPMAALEQVVIDDWIDKYAITNKGLATSEAIQVDRAGCNTRTSDFCYEAEHKNAEAIIRPLLVEDIGSSAAVAATFISVEGIGIVGAVKQVGEPTLIALKDVKNSKGEAVLIRGAIYDIEDSLLQTELIPRKKDGVRFSVVQLKQMIVKPGRFMDPSSPAFDGLFERFNNSAVSSRMLLRRQWRDLRAALILVLKSAEKYVADHPESVL